VRRRHELAAVTEIADGPSEARRDAGADSVGAVSVRYDDGRTYLPGARARDDRPEPESALLGLAGVGMAIVGIV
jgi:hypothetical protein